MCMCVYAEREREREIDRQKEGEGRKEMFCLTTHSTYFNIVIWHRTYGEGPFRQQERNPAAATTWATLFN